MGMNKREIRTKDIRIRVNEYEHELLRKNSNGQRLSPWLRSLGLGKVSKNRKVAPPVDPLLIRQLAQIGNNLNQIARIANENKKSGFDFDVFEVLETLEAIHSEIKMLREAHDDS